jgi:hypothetical protein
MPPPGTRWASPGRWYTQVCCDSARQRTPRRSALPGGSAGPKWGGCMFSLAPTPTRCVVVCRPWTRVHRRACSAPSTQRRAPSTPGCATDPCATLAWLLRAGGRRRVVLRRDRFGAWQRRRRMLRWALGGGRGCAARRGGSAAAGARVLRQRAAGGAAWARRALFLAYAGATAAAGVPALRAACCAAAAAPPGLAATWCALWRARASPAHTRAAMTRDGAARRALGC